MAKRGSKRLRPGRSGARYPTLSELSLDRRRFLAGLGMTGLGVAGLSACTEPDDVYYSDGAVVPPDAPFDGNLPDAGIPDAEWSTDGVPPLPDGGPDGGPDDGGPDDGASPDGNG